MHCGFGVEEQASYFHYKRIWGIAATSGILYRNTSKNYKGGLDFVDTSILSYWWNFTLYELEYWYIRQFVQLWGWRVRTITVWHLRLAATYPSICFNFRNLVEKRFAKLRHWSIESYLTNTIQRSVHRRYCQRTGVILLLQKHLRHRYNVRHLVQSHVEKLQAWFSF